MWKKKLRVCERERPIQVTFKEARENWKNTSADVQGDNFNSIGHNTNYIGSNLYQ